MIVAAGSWQLLLGVVGLLVYPFYLFFFHPLSRYPGPFLAKFTDYWRFRKVKGRHSHISMVAMHEKYGPLVRTGPNILSISDSAYIPKIYGLGQTFLKSDFYLPFQGFVNDRIGYNLFTTQDAHFHTAIKRPVADAYSFKSALEFEPIVDDCTRLFVRRLDEDFIQSNEKKACDLGEWMQYYAFDVIAIMTWGKAFGFIEQGKDVNNMIHTLDSRLDAIAPISQMPWIDHIKTKNWFVNLFRDKTNGFALLASRLIQDRQSEKAAGKIKLDEPKLFIDRFLEAKEAHPSVVDERAVVIYTTSNVMAGSDTVAISMRTILYMLMRDARVRDLLLAEIDAAQLSFPVTWDESQRLLYLDAVIQESLRFHPPVGMALERVVPAGGMVMQNGSRIAPNVVVGVHPWAVAHLDSIWGVDPKRFIPERWLPQKGESNDAHQRRVAAMKKASLAFGAGSRGCMGRHLGMVQMYKLIPSLLMKFRFELVDKTRDWEFTCSWFVRQAAMDAIIERR